MLFHGKQVERHLIDLPLEAVDGLFSVVDQVADADVARPVGLDRALDGLLGHARHDQQPLLQIVKALLKAEPHHRLYSFLPRLLAVDTF